MLLILLKTNIMEQRELLFNEEGKSFVSETKVNSDYNLHIEMESGGTLEIYQRGSDEGKYRRSYIELKWGDVIDADFCHAVYPKYIKIVVSSKVTKATIREAGS